MWAAWVAALIGGIGLFGVWRTVFYAGKAWEASKDSARADNEALKIAQFQLKDAREAAIEQKRFSEAQISAANRNAEAAAASAQAAQELATQDRARIHLEIREFRPLAAIEEGGPNPPLFEGVVEICIRNLGRTPAIIAPNGIASELYWLPMLSPLRYSLDPASEEALGFRSLHGGGPDTRGPRSGSYPSWHIRPARFPTERHSVGTGSDIIVEPSAEEVFRFGFRWRKHPGPDGDPLRDPMLFLLQVQYQDVYGQVRKSSIFRSLHLGVLPVDLPDAALHAKYNFQE